jgi:hypothetical protein
MIEKARLAWPRLFLRPWPVIFLLQTEQLEVLCNVDYIHAVRTYVNRVNIAFQLE